MPLPAIPKILAVGSGLQIKYILVGDSGPVVERWPLEPKVPGSNPGGAGLRIFGLTHTFGASTGAVSRKQTSRVINISL